MTTYKTAESVCKGHPDKLCDLIADNILDACLRKDRASRVACEVMATKLPSFLKPGVLINKTCIWYHTEPIIESEITRTKLTTLFGKKNL